MEWTRRTDSGSVTVEAAPIRFELDLGGLPPILEKGYLANLGCIAEIARP